MSRAAIVGAGALGLRHLQALAAVREIDAAWIADPDPAARERAVDAWVAAGRAAGSLTAVPEAAALPHGVDLAVVATDARPRPAVVEALARRGCASMVLEKVLATSPEACDAILASVRASGARAWVNCVRRTAHGFTTLREKLGPGPLSVRVDGAGWGLACNVIHHLDEWCSLTGAVEPRVHVDLEPGSVPSKRAGYREVHGAVLASEGPHTFEARCGRLEGTASGDRTVELRGSACTAVVRQSAQDVTFHVPGLPSRTEPYLLPLQSQATATHARAILRGESPSLPSLEASVLLHRRLLEALLPHFRLQDPTLRECPIT